MGRTKFKFLFKLTPLYACITQDEASVSNVTLKFDSHKNLAGGSFRALSPQAFQPRKWQEFLSKAWFPSKMPCSLCDGVTTCEHLHCLLDIQGHRGTLITTQRNWLTKLSNMWHNLLLNGAYYGPESNFVINYPQDRWP